MKLLLTWIHNWTVQFVPFYQSSSLPFSLFQYPNRIIDIAWNKRKINENILVPLRDHSLFMTLGVGHNLYNGRGGGGPPKSVGRISKFHYYSLGGLQNQSPAKSASIPYTDYFSRECSDFRLDGWVSCNPNIVRICKSARNIGRSLSRGSFFIFEPDPSAIYIYRYLN